MTTPINEQDPRLALLNTLLTTPHRNLTQLWPVHRDLAQTDPRFYVRLAAWYSDHGEVRDHKEMFIIALVLSEFPGHRDVGLALLRGLPPYQVVRVVDFINGRKERVKVRVQDGSSILAPSTKAKRFRGKKVPRVLKPTERIETLIDEIGLFRNPPRSLRTEVTRYLREREADPAWFDSTVLVARKAMKRLYALLHVKPSPRAQAVLFDEAPPADSKLTAVKELANATDPAVQAAVIRGRKLPYRVAVSVLPSPSMPVLAALVEVMSPQEVINTLGALRRKGALDDPEVKALIDAKLEAAQGNDRVSALKATEAIKHVTVDDATRRKLEAAADARVKAKGRITRPTALLIDKSGSMEIAIEMGKRIGAMLAAVCDHELVVYAFDTIAYPVEPAGPDLAAWERALVGITAGGGTSVGVAVEMLRRKNQLVEQLIVVTDEGENTAPFFVESLAKYRQELRTDPAVCIVKTPGAMMQLEHQCRTAGVSVDAFQLSGDYYSLPNLIPILARPSKLELLMEILDYPLPVRKRPTDQVML